MNLGRIWNALTRGERLVVVASTLVLAALVVVGGVLLVGTPFAESQTTPRGGQVADADADGLSDDQEVLQFGTDPGASDTDGDGLPDGWEAKNARPSPVTGLPVPDPTRSDATADPDDDALGNLAEFRNGTDPWQADTDGDGLEDGWEVRSGHDPLDPSTPSQDVDGDGLTAAREHELGTRDDRADSDRDGLEDPEEIDGSARVGSTSLSFEPTNPARTSTGGSGLPDGAAVYHDLDPHDPDVGRRDLDGDGLASSTEVDHSLDRFDDAETAILEGLDPTARDTDGDGLPDGWELSNGLDPLDATDGDGDPDGDGLGNGRELFWDSDPLDADTDGDGLPDGAEVDGWTIQLNGRSVRVTSNPLLADSDNDGLTDAEENAGSVEVDGETVAFPPTHPLLPDSDGDRLQDGFELTTFFGDDHLNATRKDTDDDGLPDGEELEYWQQRQERAASDWPDALDAPSTGECAAEARAAIQAQDPSVLGPGGDPDGDCDPNVLDADSDRRPGEDLPRATSPLTDGQELDPGETASGRSIPAADPAVSDTDGDALPDEWELRWTRDELVDGRLIFWFDPTEPDSDADGIPDGADDDDGACWTDVLPSDDDGSGFAGDSIPQRSTDGNSFPNEAEMRTNTNPFKCDTDGDGLVDGWEHFYIAHPNVAPTTALDEPWRGAAVQTVCYPGQTSDPALDNVDKVAEDTIAQRLDRSAEVPETGPVRSQPAHAGVWVLPTDGCSWVDRGAVRGSQCSTCDVAGITYTLHWAQASQTDPTRIDPLGSDTDGDGGGDAWEALWRALAGNATSRVDPGVPNGPAADADESALGQEFTQGASPLVRDTDGDGELDGVDGDPLSPLAGRGPIRDSDADHLIDGECQSGSRTIEDASRRQAAIDLEILQPEENVFLCEPVADPDGRTSDADGDGIHDAWELLHSYRDTPDNPTLGTFGKTGDADGDGVRDAVEARLGRPADWPAREPWWLGSDPLADSGLDADGDGLSEALNLDPDPFDAGRVSAAPTPTDNWDTACQADLVCPGAEPLDWSGDAGSTSFDVEVDALGHPDPSLPAPVVWKGDPLPLSVTVTRDGSPAADVPVAIAALSPSDANRLRDGAITLLSNPDRVACLALTDPQGHLPADSCSLESGPAQADLQASSRTWLGDDEPSWTRNLTVLDPLDSSTSSRQNNPALAVWAMGEGADVGATATRNVFVKANATLDLVDPPTLAPSGSTATLSASVRDAAGDPVTEGSVSADTGNDTVTRELDGASNADLDVPLPTVTEARDHTIDLEYLAPSGARSQLRRALTDHTLRVLPEPTVQIVDKPSTVTAGRTLSLGVQVAGPDGTPAQGTVEVALAGTSSTANVTLGANGTATVDLPVPDEAAPRTYDVDAAFLGSDAFAAASTSQKITVRQLLQVEASPTTALLGQPTTFALTFTDLADRAPRNDLDVTVSLGGTTRSETLDPNTDQDTLGVRLPVVADLGQTPLTVEATSEGPYAPVSETIPVEVRSEAVLEARPTQVPRGETTQLSLSLEDVLGRPVPQADVNLSWSGSNTSATIEDGSATVPVDVPADRSAGPLTVAYRVQGPGVAQASGTLGLVVRAQTNLTLDVTPRPSAGTVAVDARLTDDRGDGIPNAPLRVSWPLGADDEVRTDAEGSASTQLVLPNVTRARELVLQVRYPGSNQQSAAEVVETVTIRRPTTIDAPSELVWVRGKTLEIEGAIGAAGTDEPVQVPVEARAGDATLARTDATGAFTLEVPSAQLSNRTRDTASFALEVATPGTDRWSSSSATVLVKELTPVDVTLDANRTGGSVEATVQVRSPDGPVPQAEVAIATADGAPVTVTTGQDGRARVTLNAQDASELVALYRGDDAHAPSEARINVAQPAAPADANLVWLVVAAVVALAAVDVWIGYRVLQRIQIGRQIDEIMEEAEEKLIAEDELRAVIYAAYQRLGAIGEAMGIPEEETDTPREFAGRLAGKLNLAEEPMRGVVGVFEQARYGAALGPQHRAQAHQELVRVREQLRETGLVA